MNRVWYIWYNTRWNYEVSDTYDTIPGLFGSLHRGLFVISAWHHQLIKALVLPIFSEFWIFFSSLEWMPRCPFLKQGFSIGWGELAAHHSSGHGAVPLTHVVPFCPDMAVGACMHAGHARSTPIHPRRKRRVVVFLHKKNSLNLHWIAHISSNIQ